MITNKDGSYNKFRLLILSLIIITLISITGVYISQNVQIPKIENPFLGGVQTPSPTPVSTPIPIDPEIAELYNGNSSNITSWNWSYTNFSNVSNWTPPPEFITNTHNITYIAGGGGGSSGYTNISYIVVAGGGGSGGMGYTGILHTNSTYTGNTTAIHEVTPEITYNLSQNISAVIGEPLAPLGITNPLLVMILIGLPLVLLFSNRSVSSVFPIMFGLLIIGMFLKLEFWSIVAMIMLIPFLTIIFSDR